MTLCYGIVFTFLNILQYINKDKTHLGNSNTYLYLSIWSIYLQSWLIKRKQPLSPYKMHIFMLLIVLIPFWLLHWIPFIWNTFLVEISILYGEKKATTGCQWLWVGCCCRVLYKSYNYYSYFPNLSIGKNLNIF